jgi:uncharacterized protein YdaU (DUF1376 family)
MSKAPAFQLYAADFDMDTASWTCPQVGVYIRLLLSAWVNGGIPNNMAELARIARIDTRTLAKMWRQTLAKKWEATPENLYVNPRMEIERKKQAIYAESQRIKGITRSKKMWEGHIATAKNRLQPKNSSSSSSSIKEKKEKKILSDEDWLKTLEDNPIYEGIEVRVLYGKMLVWCTNNGKKPTRRRFVNWLNREDKPMKQGMEKPETPKGKPTLRCQKCEKLFFHLIRIREMNLCSDCAEKV